MDAVGLGSAVYVTRPANLRYKGPSNPLLNTSSHHQVATSDNQNTIKHSLLPSLQILSQYAFQPNPRLLDRLLGNGSRCAHRS